MVDIIFLAIIFYFLISGLQKGFLAYFLEFLLISVCVFGSWLYYKETHNFLYSLIILFFSPVVLAIIFRFLFHVSSVGFQNLKWPNLSHLNNIAGGVIGFIWGIFWTIIICLIINIVPVNNQIFLKFKENISNSFVLKFIKDTIPLKEVFFIYKINELSKIFNNPEAIRDLKNDPEFVKLMEEEKIQNFIKDRTVINQLKNKQILSLIDNPKFIVILEDIELLKRFIQFDFNSTLKNKSQK